MSEGELVARAVAGDQVAIRQLLVLNYPAVVAFIEQKLPADLRRVLSAEDVCQDTFAAAVRQLSGFQPGGKESFRNWLLTIAERKLIDAVRALRAAKRGGGRRALPEGSPHDTSTAIVLLERIARYERTPSRSAVDHELVAAVQAALTRLKDEYQQVIRTRYIEGLSVAETAERMGRTEGAVRMLCQRGLRLLTTALGDVSRLL